MKKQIEVNIPETTLGKGRSSIHDSSSESMAKRNHPEYSQLKVYISRKIHKGLKIKAIEEEREMSELVQDLLSQYLEK